MRTGYYLILLGLMTAGCTQTPTPGTQCSTKLLTPEEMANTATSPQWR